MPGTSGGTSASARTACHHSFWNCLRPARSTRYGWRYGRACSYPKPPFVLDKFWSARLPRYDPGYERVRLYPTPSFGLEVFESPGRWLLRVPVRARALVLNAVKRWAPSHFSMCREQPAVRAGSLVLNPIKCFVASKLLLFHFSLLILQALSTLALFFCKTWPLCSFLLDHQDERLVRNF